MVSNCNMFSVVMEDMIIRQFDYTLIITHKYCLFCCIQNLQLVKFP
jgi:hypothetical protein